MSNSLVITKETGNYFSLALNSDPVIRSEQNRLTTVGNQCHFKTASGANIVKEQNVLFNEITLISGGTFTFASVQLLWAKLIEVGFFNGLGVSGGGGGATKFINLTDTFNSYLGRNGQTLIVNESQQKLESVPFYNFKKFTELQDTPSVLLPNKMITTSADGLSLVMTDIPTIPEPYLNSVGFLDYSDTATGVTPLALVANTNKKLTNDGLGATTNKNYPPYGVTDVWNSISGQMFFTQLANGDEISVRFDITATTTSANQQIKAFIRLGVGTASQYDLQIFTENVKTAGANQFTFLTRLYIGSEIIRTSPAEFYAVSDGTASVRVNGWYFSIIRRNINVISVETVVADTFKTDLTYAGSNITVPTGTKIRNVYLNNIPCSAIQWTQTGTSIAISTAINGDLVTLIN